MELIPHGQSPTSGRDWNYIWWLVYELSLRNDILVEKSRDMLVSWILMAVTLHDVMFRKNWPVMTISYKEELVDDGGETSTEASLLGKVRFIYEHLPSFLQNAFPLMFSHMHIKNVMLNSHITGYPATPTAGRGPKWQRAIADEFAHLPWSEQVMASMASACPRGKVLASTPYGKVNAFARIRWTQSFCVYPQHEAATKHWRRLTLHWTQHPERDEAWKERKIAEGSLTDEAVAQELEINYEKSKGRRVYPKFVYERHIAGAALCSAQSARYDPTRALYLCMDFNPDPLVWVLLQPHVIGPRFRVIGQIMRRNAIAMDGVLEFVCRFGSQKTVGALLNSNPEYENAYARESRLEAGDAGHILPVVIYGDATEEKSTVYSRVKIYQQIKQTLRQHGFDVVLKVPPANPPRQLRFETVNDALRHDLCVFSPAAEQVIKDFEEGVWNGQQTDIDKNVRDDDGSGLTRSHASDALGYALCQLHKVTTSVGSTGRAGPKRPISDMMPEIVRGWGRRVG